MSSHPEERARPLDGITVVDFTVNIAGPCTTLVLADLGARVLKVEAPGGDVSREWFPQDDAGFSTVFSAFNRGKESVVIDAKSPQGRELIHRLVAQADVFVESMRPGKAAALGLGWEDLHALNHQLVYCSLNAFGDVGPMAGMAGFDAVIQAYSGLMELTGYPDGDPARVGGAVIDVGTGAWAALGVVAALMQRQRDGRGQRVQMTLLGTAVGYLMHHLTSARLAGVEPKRLGTAQHNFAPYQAIKTADRMVMVGVNSDGMWRRAAAALGVPGLADDERFRTNVGRIAYRDELISELESALEKIPSETVVNRLMSASVPASVVRPISALVDDPQLEALGFWGRTPSGVPLPRTPVGDSGHGFGDVPPVGAHTVEILREFGVSDQVTTELERAKIIEIAHGHDNDREHV